MTLGDEEYLDSPALVKSQGGRLFFSVELFCFSNRLHH